MPDTGLSLESVVIQQDGRTLVDISDHIAPGEVLTVMGPSGSGKSTLLSYVIGTLSDDFAASGRVVLNGRDITDLAPEQRRVGILFQDELLFPHLSVGENLAFGLRATVKGRAERKTQIEAALEDIGLSGFASRDPETLAGGQKARVALMRMLLSGPRALLLDEPFSRLDTERRDQVRSLVFDRARSKGLPVLLVTHDHADAEAAGGRVLNAFEQGGFISVGFQPKQFVHDAARLDQESEHLLLGSGQGGQVAGQLDGYVLVQLGLDGGGWSSFGRGFGCRAGALTGANGEGK